MGSRGQHRRLEALAEEGSCHAEQANTVSAEE